MFEFAPRMKNRCSVPSAWRSKVQNALSTRCRPLNVCCGSNLAALAAPSGTRSRSTRCRTAGLKLKSTETALENIIEIFDKIGHSKWQEFVMGFTFLVLLLLIKYLAKNHKKLAWMRPLGPITICIISIIAVVVGDLDGKKIIKTVKNVPKGARRAASRLPGL
jgi:Sulfate permease family